MVERVLVVGPKDTISMVDDLAPKGFEIVKALHNSPEMKAALPGTTYFVGFVQQYVTPQLFKESPKLKLIQMLSAGYDRADLELTRQQIALIKAVTAVQPKTVVILNNGAPVAMSARLSSAIVPGLE